MHNAPCRKAKIKYKGVKKMKKVYYSVKRYKRNEMIEQKGVGYITDTDSVIACISQNNFISMRNIRA